MALHVAAIAAIYCMCPVSTSGDSRWTVPTALEIIHHGSTSIQVPVAEQRPEFGIEVAPNGHTYARYPVWVAVIAVPFVAAIEGITRAVHPHWGSSTVQRLFCGDLAGTYPLVEMVTASALMALAAGIQMLTALEFLSLRLASLLTLSFAFATPVWSTASRAMWNHTPALLMLSAAIYLLVLARRRPHVVGYSSLPLAAAFMMRPTMAIAVVILSVYVAAFHRAELLRFVLLAAGMAAIFLSYNLIARGQLLQNYYFVDPGGWPVMSWPKRFTLQLVSPSRGLFVFCPLALFSVLGIWLAWRRRWLFPLAPWLAAILVAQVFLVAKFFWPGVSYGPRYFTDVTPILTLFLIPVMQTKASRIWRGAFVLAATWSVFVQARGATDFRVHDWSGHPTLIDQDPERVWDWKDPQFLRGMH